jgi:hypothetical protein
MVYLTQALSEFKCSNICIKSDDSFSKTPSALIERLMNFTGRNLNNNNNNNNKNYFIHHFNYLQQ